MGSGPKCVRATRGTLPRSELAPNQVSHACPLAAPSLRCWQLHLCWAMCQNRGAIADHTAGGVVGKRRGASPHARVALGNYALARPSARTSMRVSRVDCVCSVSSPAWAIAGRWTRSAERGRACEKWRFAAVRFRHDLPLSLHPKIFVPDRSAMWPDRFGGWAHCQQ